ncbi:signal peptidase I Serine peptidase. MEROPS family S26A [Rubrimonas cliftonensis]|uniref:Signal peptidase I n=2 Tax=Rubrimonas cliftonensis TaxID=89524 RepID=A0A1H3YKQ8_9RHOB|nr:signal peptidase I Serine peptidase. MEROPS family S26A [Rubrimonas cliftonensis]
MRGDGRGMATGKVKKKEGFLELLKTIVYALLIAGVFRTILFQPFWIPSGSMKSTLLIGDYLFISKYAYGYSAASCPTVFGVNLCPFISGRVLADEPDRGDVIVFKHPRTEEDYIKRLIGLPGDRIQMRSGVLRINGEAVGMERDGVFLDDSAGFCSDRRTVDGETVCALERWRETLPGGVAHTILNTADGMAFDDTPEFVVPEEHYFFMGDNRDNSRDSREPRASGGVGFVPFENLIGRAEVIAVSADGPFWRVWDWRFGRSFSAID